MNLGANRYLRRRHDRTLILRLGDDLTMSRAALAIDPRRLWHIHCRTCGAGVITCTELRSVTLRYSGSHILNSKNPDRLRDRGFIFRSLAPLRANALEQAARRARVIRIGTKPNFWLCLSQAHPTLSWGPHVRKTTPEKTKPRALSYSGFSFLEAWR